MLIIIESSNFSKFSGSQYYGEILFHLSLSKLTELHGISFLNLCKYGEQQILGLNLPQNLWTGNTLKNCRSKL